MFEQLSVFEDEAGYMERDEARIRLTQLFFRRWPAVWDDRAFPRGRRGPREETVHPKPQYL